MRIGWGMLALLGAAVGGCTGPNDCAAASWEPCDIRDAACQRTVLAAVQCDRGHVLDTVPSVRIITPEALRLELDQAPTTSSPVRDAAYQTLGLIPRTGGLRDAEIDALVANLLASYSSERQQITIIDRGAAMSSADASATFAHELVHAMQDALYDLDAYQAAVHTSDEREARRTVVEGEAQFFQILYQIRQLQHRPEEAPWDQFYASWREAVLTQIGTSDAPLVATRNAYPYLAGAEQLTGEWRAQPRGSVASAWFEMPPTATIDVMRSRGRGAGARGLGTHAGTFRARPVRHRARLVGRQRRRRGRGVGGNGQELPMRGGAR